MQQDIVLVYITAKDKDEAVFLARALLEARMIACANIHPGMESLYWWEGTIHSSQECLLIVKSRQAMLEAITQKVKELHSYDCPCVVALPATGGDEGYLEWIYRESGGNEEL